MNPMYIETSEYGRPVGQRTAYEYESEFDGGLPFYGDFGLNPITEMYDRLARKKGYSSYKELKEAANKLKEERSKPYTEHGLQNQKVGINPLVSIAIIALVGIGGSLLIRKIL